MTALACFLALVLGSAAAHKLIARERLTAATGRLLGINAALAFPAMLAAAAIEAVAALALLIPATQMLGAAMAMLLWTSYAVALWRSDAGADCGCSFGVHRGGIDRFARVRPLVLVLAAVPVLLFPGGYDVVAPFAGLALFAMYLAAGEIAQTRSFAR